jgi:hypothetical protein
VVGLSFGGLSALPGKGVESGADFKEAKIVGILNGKDVRINREPATVGKVGGFNSLVQTGKAKAKLQFDPRRLKNTFGIMKPDTTIKVGNRCFRLESVGSEIWVDGKQNGCGGSAMAGSLSTSYVLARIGEDRNRISVMNGQAFITNESNPEIAAADDVASPPDRDNRFPRFNPIFGLGASAYTSNSGGVELGESSALVLGDVNLYLPLWQQNISRVVYSYTSVSSNFDGFWGASSEIGYRWYSPARKSSQGIFIGYDGVEDPSCFHSQISLGAEYLVSRWTFGANGGIRADDCESSVSYATAQIGIPIAQIGDNTARLNIAPYVVTGLGNDYFGGRVGVSIPVSDHLSLTAYGQYDRLFDTVIGGSISYRFGAGKNFIQDPHRAPNPIPSAAISRQKATPALIASSTLSPLVDQEGGGIVQNDTMQILQAGEEVVFNDQGEVLSRERMSKERFQELVESFLTGFDLMPESLAVFATYKQLYGESTPSVMAVTGAQWAIGARNPYPRLRGGDILTVPEDKLPQESEPIPEELLIIDFSPTSTP